MTLSARERVRELTLYRGGPLRTKKKKKSKLCTSIRPLERDARLILHRKRVCLFSMSIYMPSLPSFPAFLTAVAGSRGLHLECYPLERKFLVAHFRFDQSDVPLAIEGYFFFSFLLT